ncbi:MAG: alpha-ribazole-5-phosphate synthase, partial [Firmicutes bacterium]|nr:alpha-ribazole-5-phosphate synthase [Bacillota bacterium]
MVPKVRQLRDVTVIDMADGSLLVVACDSLGAIGSKENDLVKVPGYVVGRMTSRVALLEVMSTGARPLVLINALAVEMTPTGEEI